jgi:carboxyl-terminal processing protease
MDTLPSMFKRILILTRGRPLGFAACLARNPSGGLVEHLSRTATSTAPRTTSEGGPQDRERELRRSGGAELRRAGAALHPRHGRLLDPHSEYLESKDNQELEEDLDGEYGGIGIEVETHNGAFAVVDPIAGSPGDKAGILAGDEITSIDGKPVDRGLPMETVVNRLRGKPRTHVRVGLLRPRLRAHLDLDLVREVIKVESVGAPA